MPRRGGRRGDGGDGDGKSVRGDNIRSPIPREVIVSKKISWVLRHAAVQKGLKMDENGYVNCGELVSGKNENVYGVVLVRGAFWGCFLRNWGLLC